MHSALTLRRIRLCARGLSAMDGLLAELRTLNATLERTERISPDCLSDVASQAAATLVMRIGTIPNYSPDDNNNFLDELEHVAEVFGNDNIAAITRAGNTKALNAGVTAASRACRWAVARTQVTHGALAGEVVTERGEQARPAARRSGRIMIITGAKRSHPMSHLLGCDMGHLLISRKFAPRGPVYPGQIPPGVPATRAGRQYIH